MSRSRPVIAGSEALQKVFYDKKIEGVELGMMLLGVNIDHVATLRNARGGIEPEPVYAAHEAELGGADGITVHLREDRRHIKDRDLKLLKETTHLPLNLEMAATDEITEIAIKTKPYMCTLVPEKRQEVTTERGLDLIASFEQVKCCAAKLMDSGIEVSLFIDANREQIDRVIEIKAKFIELHTGTFANAEYGAQIQELTKIKDAYDYANSLGIVVNAGHGIDYRNINLLNRIKGLHELNIGHSIISRAIFVGLRQAVREMKNLMEKAAALAL
jgi:pyridoxine 5-phosphate synthase